MSAHEKQMMEGMISDYRKSTNKENVARLTSAQKTATEMESHMDEIDLDISNSSDGFMTTYTGVKFAPLTPKPEMVNIEDIAHALSLICRWGGHIKKHYSVAQHCVSVSLICKPEDAKKGLLHDAAEAYIGDMIRPLKYLKKMYGVYKLIEGRVDGAIAKRFDLDNLEKPDSVQWADMVMLAHEALELRRVPSLWAKDSLDVLGNPKVKVGRIWSMEEAEEKYLARFEQLFGKEYLGEKA